jgi:hypothetical protein
MPYIYITSFSGPPATVTVCDFATETICYTSPTQITNVGPFPYIINLPSPDFDLVSTISLSAQSDNGCLIIQSDTCSVLPTPTPSPLPNCSYVIFGTNDNFVTSGTVDYLDCNLVQQTYTATTTGTFGLCLISASTSNEIDVIDDETYQCTYSEGDWYPPYIESPTPTPSNPPTPTPSPSSGLTFMEMMYIDANASTNDLLKVTIYKNPAQQIFIDWGDGSVTGVTGPGGVYNHTYSSPYNGQVKISGYTTIAGQIPNVQQVLFAPSILSEAYSSKYSASTSEIVKFTDMINFGANINVYGTINDFSATTQIDSINIGWGTYSGDVVNLPNTVSYFSIKGSSGNTVGGSYADLPSSIEYFVAEGRNTISGDVQLLTGYTNLNTLSGYFHHETKYSQGAVSGLCENLPNTGYIYIDGTSQGEQKLPANQTGNTITGNLHIKSNHKEIFIGGKNTISGGFSGTSNAYGGRLDNLRIYGFNQISGDLSQLVVPSETLVIVGNNTVTGNISSMNTSASITIFKILNLGQDGTGTYSNFPNIQTGIFSTPVTTGNTISGNLSTINTMPSLTQFVVIGNNTLTGDLGSVTIPNLQFMAIGSTGNTINGATFSPGDFVVSTDGLLTLYTLSSGLSSSEVDGIMTQVLNVITPGQNIVMGILGSHAAPTPAGVVTKNTIMSSYPNSFIYTN